MTRYLFQFKIPQGIFTMTVIIIIIIIIII